NHWAIRPKASNGVERRSRLGVWGLVSRHIDGSIPQDYLAVVENIALNNLMRELYFVRA
ncbi:MAG: hypothetical protein HC780_27965, partial [Leptolyngbyaceae cyanobacterium CSU_1_3]|nr:hypothetical protein [Leptolyngbyaceae cyanobacterium CSU_1_3]